MGLDELEASLQAAWDDDTAAVYADRLTADGDPRGELIAIDLALAKAYRSDLVERKHALINEWVNPHVWGWTPRPHEVRFGLLRTWVAGPDAMDRVGELEHTVGGLIYDLALGGTNEQLEPAILQLASGGLPWLRRLVIPNAMSSTAWDALVHATPHLCDLRTDGKITARAIAHPAVRTLRTDVRSLMVEAPFEAVDQLDLELPHAWEAAIGPFGSIVHPRWFPALRTLDLSRNRELHDLSRSVAVGLLEAIGDLAWLELVRLPALDQADVVEVAAILEAHPRLRIELAHCYVPSTTTHPRLYVPPKRAWPEAPYYRCTLAVSVPGAESGDLELPWMIRHLAAQFDAMSPDRQAAWNSLWAFVRQDIEWPDDDDDRIYKPFPSELLLTAVDSLEGDEHCYHLAAQLRASSSREVRIAGYHRS